METFVSKDGVRIASWRSGTGTPLVLVHGTTADHTRWAPVLPVLEGHFTVHACDRRGRGGSGDSPSYSIEREAEDIAAVVDGIGGPVDLLGHSYGAICALGASLQAHHLNRLVLYEPPVPSGVPTYPEGIVDRLQAIMEAGDGDGVVSTFFAEVVGAPPDDLALMRSKASWPARVAAAHTIVRELRASMAYFLSAERFRTMNAPTLLLLGGASPPAFKSAIELLNRVLPRARVAVMPGQRHVAMDSAPELFLGEVLPFLGQS